MYEVTGPAINGKKYDDLQSAVTAIAEVVPHPTGNDPIEQQSDKHWVYRGHDIKEVR